MSKEQKKREDGFEHLEEALTSGEQFIEKNQKMIVNVVLVLVVIIAGYFGYNMPKKLPTRFSERKTISKKILSIWP
jgi:Na+/H+ antiporter NhaC